VYDHTDEAFVNALDTFLHETLEGDRKFHGLYRTVLASQNWDDFNRTRGAIQAYEAVRSKMHEIVQRMNGDEHDHQRRGMN
jgi:hypothetical protein